MTTGEGDERVRQTVKQQQIIAHLSRRPSWDTPRSRAEDIRIAETHGAYVLIGKAHAIKIKKAVTFDYMDYGTLENRHRFCLREMELNRRTAPQLYLNIAPIYQTGQGEIALIPDADTPATEVVEWMLKMRRFDPGSRFDILAVQGGLNDRILDDLTDIVAGFHGALDGITDLDVMVQNRRSLARNFDQLDDFVPALFSAAEINDFRQALAAQLERHSQVLTKRSRQGYVRFAHGDLHLQNICLLDGKPTLYDGVEYCDDFAISDILYDLSFLLMDLKANLSVAAANRVLNRYFMHLGALTRPQEFEALTLLPYFLSIRAGIRAHVFSSRYLEHGPDVTGADALKATARSYFKQAIDYLKPSPPRLIAIGGFSGSGKSTLSKAIAPLIGSTVGALHIRSDIIRRKLMNWDEFAQMPDAAYTARMSEQVYDLMRQIAVTALKAGQSVVLDAVFDRPVDRKPLTAISDHANAAFDGIWLDATALNMTKRIGGRTKDASDATVSVLHAQLDRASKNEKDIEWACLDANAAPEQVLSQAQSILARIN